MGVSGGSLSPGATVVEWDCNGHSDQEWIYVPTGGYANGWPLYNIENLNSGQCLGVSGGSKALGAQVVQWSCNGHPDQEWY
jgi:galactose oxidase